MPLDEESTRYRNQTKTGSRRSPRKNANGRERFFNQKRPKAIKEASRPRPPLIPNQRGAGSEHADHANDFQQELTESTESWRAGAAKRKEEAISQAVETAVDKLHPCPWHNANCKDATPKYRR